VTGIYPPGSKSREIASDTGNDPAVPVRVPDSPLIRNTPFLKRKRRFAWRVTDTISRNAISQFLTKMIRHHAFFEALGSLDKQDVAWQPTLAGLAVLRLFDFTAESPRRDMSDDWAAHRTARDSVAALPEGNPARAILMRILDRLGKAPGDSEDAGRELLSLGRLLDLEGRWPLAADVFQTIAQQFSSREHAQLVIESCTALGAAARQTGDWHTSARAYAQAQHLADAIGDEAASLTVEVGIANSRMIRGNLPAAEAELEKVLIEARARGFSQVEARALHSQASVAHSRGNYEQAIHLAYRSLELTIHRTSRDRILADIAAAYAGLGMRETARDGYLIVAVTSPHQWVRWQATLNLMELAVDVGDECQFDAYVRQMEVAPLDARLRAYFLFFLALGSRRFGREGSDDQFHTAERFASRHELNQIAFEIEAALEKPPVETEKAGANAGTSFAREGRSEELERIAEALLHLRERVTA
jgi:tetratricopeptide (TPR) repeat protein